MKVVKRDGTEVDFQGEKIRNAILKAFIDKGYTINATIDDFVAKVESEIESLNKTLNVEEIQDIVVKKLMSSKYKDVASAYIEYRALHEMARNQYKELMNAVSEKLMASDVQNQNANVDEKSFGGRIGEMADLVAKKYALDYLISPMAKANHLNNEIYIHDLGHYATGDHNCLSVPFDKLLAQGFNTRQTDVRPAQSINTAFQLVAVIFQLQSLQQFGGVSATHLDWTMVPYVRKSFVKHWNDGCKYIEGTLIRGIPPINASIEDDYFKKMPKAYQYALDMTTKECYQAVEGMYHNLNTLQSRSGNQLPFTSINYGTCTLPEGRMVIKALLEGSINGVGEHHLTPIFPCGIFQCMKGVNRKEGEPNYDLFKLALESTSQRIYPNYVNVDWSVNAGYDPNNPRTYTATMGKRKLQLIAKIS